eukprot:9470406-Pyramimonas_sp.AAC.1
MDFGTSSEYIHLSSAPGPKDLERPQKIGSRYFSGVLGPTAVSEQPGQRVREDRRTSTRRMIAALARALRGVGGARGQEDRVQDDIVAEVLKRKLRDKPRAIPKSWFGSSQISRTGSPRISST